MAKFIPKIEVEEILNKPERDVARELQSQLPNDCIIYHSYPWLKEERSDWGSSTLKEGEADFLIIFPGKGFLVLEVKGGRIEFSPSEHEWHRILPSKKTKRIKDPFEQARKNMHVLKGLILKQYGLRENDNLSFPYGYAVIFPDCVYEGPDPTGASKKIVLSANDLTKLETKIPGILELWKRSGTRPVLESTDLDKIRAAIYPVFRLFPILFREIEEQEEMLVRLTDEQYGFLEFAAKQDRAVIEGVAGSGKTLLARAQAQNFADQGNKILFLCYNKELAKWIHDSLPDNYFGKIIVRHFHGVCSEWCKKAGISFKVPTQNQDYFWKEDAAALLLDAIDKIDERFDAVVVDEGQDFFADWWLPIEAINSKLEKGKLFIFLDPAQNLFVDEELSFPDLPNPFILPTNCRNTVKITDVCSDILKLKINTKSGAPDGHDPIIKIAPTSKEQKKLISETLTSWVKKGKMRNSQIAILSPYRKENSSLKGLTEISSIPITENLLEWKAESGVLFSTIRSFKGLEADAVLLIDIPKPGSIQNFSNADYYVACSRAKHLLTVLKKEE
jgi:hypothetical protein